MLGGKRGGGENRAVPRLLLYLLEAVEEGGKRALKKREGGRSEATHLLSRFCFGVQGAWEKRKKNEILKKRKEATSFSDSIEMKAGEREKGLVKEEKGSVQSRRKIKLYAEARIGR